MKCSKCQSTEQIEKHHLFPQIHYGKGKNNPQKIALCHNCHHTLEIVILGIEMFTGGVPFGRRYRLSREGYIEITRKYLSNSKIVELAT